MVRRSDDVGSEMEYQAFIGRIQDRTGLGEQASLQVVQATFTTLSDRLAGGAPSNLGSELPERVKTFLAEEGRGEVFGFAEFKTRLAARMDAEPDVAIRHAQAVVDVVRQAVSGQVVDRVADQLPDDYAPLFEPPELSSSD